MHMKCVATDETGPSVCGRRFIYLYPARQLSDWTIVPTPLKSTWLTAINTEENPVGTEQTIFSGITSALRFWHGSKKWPVVKELGFACCAGRTSLALYLSAAHTAINTADAMHAIYYRAEHNQIMQTEDKQIKVCSSSRLQPAVLSGYWPQRSAIWVKSTEWQMLPKCKVHHDLPLNANFMRLFFFFWLNTAKSAGRLLMLSRTLGLSWYFTADTRPNISAFNINKHTRNDA